MKSVVGYCRTGYALGSDPTANATRQAQEIERYAECQGLTIHETYMDPGVSGITLDRPELQRLLTDCRAGKIGTVVTKDPDRLSRNPAQLIALLDVFRETGVRVQFATPGGWTDLTFLMLFLPALVEVDERR